MSNTINLKNKILASEKTRGLLRKIPGSNVLSCRQNSFDILQKSLKPNSSNSFQPLAQQSLPRKDNLLSTQSSKIKTAGSLRNQGDRNYKSSFSSQPGQVYNFPEQAKGNQFTSQPSKLIVDLKNNQDIPDEVLQVDFQNQHQQESQQTIPPVQKVSQPLQKKLEPFRPFFNIKIVNWGYRSLALFAILALLITSPIYGLAFFNNKVDEVKQETQDELENILEQVIQGASSFSKSDYNQAKLSFDNALKELDNIDTEIKQEAGILADIAEIIPIKNKATSAANLLVVIKEVTKTGSEIADLMLQIENIEIANAEKDLKQGFNLLQEVEVDEISITDSLEQGSEDLCCSGDETPNLLIAKLKVFIENLEVLEQKSQTINQALEKVDPESLDEYESIAELVKEFGYQLSNSIQILSAKKESLLYLLGEDAPRRFLILNQNSAEMRATGGFIGSFSILEINKGNIETVDVQGVYDADGQVQDKIIPPKPLQVITQGWSMHDANWFLDYPTSAQLAMDFYEKSGAESVDGVIALNVQVLKSLLEISGPIDLPQSQLNINSENFENVIQDQVESLGAEGDKKPKQVLAELAPILLEKFMSGEAGVEGLFKLLPVLTEHLSQRDIMIYLQDDDMQNHIKEIGWDGSVVQVDKDYLSIVHSNLGGSKSDRMMTRESNLKVEVQDDGTIVNILQIKQKHNGGQEKYEWLNGVNNDYLRLYVPQGSEIIEASGFGDSAVSIDFVEEWSNFKPNNLVQEIEAGIQRDEEKKLDIFKENSKTVFGGWVVTQPGQESFIEIKYKLPFELKEIDNYSFYFQKQSGLKNSEFNVDFDWEDYGVVKEIDLGNEKLGADWFKGVVLKKN